MPHSSGGGSHSGGSHGGSHHSSGGHGGSSGSHYSSRPFANSRRFRYYDRHGAEKYVYSSSEPKPESVGYFIFRIVFFLPFIVVGLGIALMWLVQLLPPRALKPEYVDSGTHIEDNIGVIDNKSELEDILIQFKDKTGICPIVLTVNDSEWDANYSYLENYAYSYYINHFDDEQHFLVVYSQPDNAAELDFVDWSWEIMQGNDTDKILSEDKVSIFRDELHKQLSIDSVSVGEAFSKAFSDSLGYMMKSNANIMSSVIMLGFVLFWNGIVLFMMVSSVKSFVNSRRNYTEVSDYETIYSDIEK